ncbi:ankyrin repeat domain-containing protein 52 [Colletotrichum incanum]|nr:ankyrin repeat domain-containing protein 52 [Colletotrichum incanum]
MEPAGFAVGILGLAGLFSACLEAVDNVQSYRSARTDADVQDTLFNAAKARFEQWGRGVGIDHGRLLDDHHPALDDKGISTAVGDLLHFTIKFICDDNHTSLRNLTQTAGSGDGLPVSLRARHGAPPEPRRRKLVWALRGKGERTEQVNLFGKLVQGLYNLVPPDTAQESRLLLWINGPPGFGKTILCARIVEHLSSSLQTPVAHFFFSSDLESRNDPFSAIRSWISQVVSQHEDAFEYVRQMLNADLDPVATRATSMIIFTRLLHIIPGSIYVIDGLDECTSSDTGSISVAAFLRSVADAISGTDSKVLLVSRDEHKIRNALVENDLEGFIEHKISPNDVRQDTTAVSREIVNRKLSNKGDDVRSTLSEAMTSRCDGQFLWLKMQEESLRKGMNQKQLQQAVNDSPTGLDRLYDNTWAEITRYGEPERLRTFALLRWAAFAVRPLTVSEITEAAIIDDHGDLSLEDLPDAVDEDYIETEILGLCSPLLEVQSESSASSPGQQTVHLVHFTVREYLLPKLPPPIWLQQDENLRVSHEKLQSTILAKACLHYINSRRVWIDKTLDSPAPLAVSFLNYAATSWHRHIKFGLDNHPEVSRLAVDLFSRRNSVWDAWRVMMEAEDAKQEKRLAETDPPGPLYYAVRFQLMSLIVILIKKEGCDVNEASGLGRSALHRACWDGAVDIVAILLENGANTAVANKNGWTPMQIASDKGHADVVKLLIEKGADVTVATNDGRTPLISAANNGHIEVVKLLIEKGADIAVVTNNGWTPVNIASDSGRTEVVRLLIEEGADVITATSNGWTPIMSAASNGHIEVVKLLIEKGADITVATDNGETSMHASSGSGHAKVVQLLLNNPDIEVDGKDNFSRTPLFLASRSGHYNVMQLLLADSRTTPASTDWYGTTPLFAAVRNGHTEASEALLTIGAVNSGPEARDGFGRTLRWWAHKTGNSKLVELLAQHADRVGNPIQDVLPVDTLYVTLGSSSYWCDACTLSIPDGCNIGCDGGEFDLCGECFSMGIKCPDKTHTMLPMPSLPVA